MHDLAQFDVENIQRLIDRPVPGLTVVLTCAVDYRGQRWLAQAPLPGIFSTQRSVQNLYGRVEDPTGQTTMFRTYSDPETHQLMATLADRFLLAESKCSAVDATAESAELIPLWTSSDVKVIRGSDSLRYLLDCGHLTPVDANWSPEFELIRPELLNQYKNFQLLESLQSEQSEVPKAMQRAAEKLKSLRYNANLSPNDAKQDSSLQSLAKFITEHVIPQFVHDTANQFQTPADGEQLIELMHRTGLGDRYLGAVAQEFGKIDARGLEQLCQVEMVAQAVELIAKQRFSYTQHLVAGQYSKQSASDAESLARLLSSLAGCTQWKSLTASQLSVAQIAMDKFEQQWSQIRQHLQDESRYTEQSLSQSLTASDNNSGSGDSAESSLLQSIVKRSRSAKAIQTLRVDNRRAQMDPFTASNLWVQCKKILSQRFRYECDPLSFDVATRRCLLRNVCRRLGIQIIARDYDFSSESPITTADIAGVQPIVRGLRMRSRIVDHTMQDSLSLLKDPRSFSAAVGALHEALQSATSVFGDLHPTAARILSLIAQVLSSTEQPLEAVQYHTRVLMIVQRVFGIDSTQAAAAHSALAAAYANLAGEHQKNKSNLPSLISVDVLRSLSARHHIRHAYLSTLISGSASAHSAIALHNFAIGINQSSIASEALLTASCLDRIRKYCKPQHILIAEAASAHATILLLCGRQHWSNCQALFNEARDLLRKILPEQSPRVQQAVQLCTLLSELTDLAESATDKEQSQATFAKIQSVSSRVLQLAQAPLRWLSVDMSTSETGVTNQMDADTLLELLTVAASAPADSHPPIASSTPQLSASSSSTADIAAVASAPASVATKKQKKRR